MSEQIARDYFEFIASIGITKHPGSMAATRKLIALCHIDREKYVLDVGCGLGATPSYLAKTTGCRVFGVDLLGKMVAQSRARVKADGLEQRVEFRVADARDLPFEDHQFDTVISESVTSFSTTNKSP
jgi:cyclopropane fatty-acyl-phospholipid synthase-like methyltransferase